MANIFACGLGFKCAEEAVLGTGSTFSKHMLQAFEDLGDDSQFSRQKSLKRPRSCIEEATDIPESANCDDASAYGITSILKIDIDSDSKATDACESSDTDAMTVLNSQVSIKPLDESLPCSLLRLPQVLIAGLFSLENTEIAHSSDHEASFTEAFRSQPCASDVVNCLRQAARYDITQKIHTSYGALSLDSAMALAKSIEAEIFSLCFDIEKCSLPKDTKLFDSSGISNEAGNCIEPISLEEYCRCWRMATDVLSSSKPFFEQIADGDLAAVRIVCQTALYQNEAHPSVCEGLSDSESNTDSENANGWEIGVRGCDMTDSGTGLRADCVA